MMSLKQAMAKRSRGALVTGALLYATLAFFAFNSLAHEATCHDEMAGVCHSLHGSWTDAWALQPVDRVELRPLGAWLTWDHEPLAVPAFIKNIFHPPD
jgi:hypothetical protein